MFDCRNCIYCEKANVFWYCTKKTELIKIPIIKAITCCDYIKKIDVVMCKYLKGFDCTDCKHKDNCLTADDKI